MKRLRVGVKMVLAVGASFCAGLLVFYLPEHKYASLSEVWLPHETQESRDAILDLPIGATRFEDKGVSFKPMHAGNTELIEVNAARHKLKAAACPNFYHVDTPPKPSCTKIGIIGGFEVYASHRRLPSSNVQVYTMRGDTLIAATGFYTEQEAAAYVKRLVKVPRREVNGRLADNRARVETVVTAITSEKRRLAAKGAQAYRHLPFTPVLPAILPAGWVQQFMRLNGTNPSRPTSAEVYYKKGRDQSIRIVLVPREGFNFGEACGPLPATDTPYVTCKQVEGTDYYKATLTEADSATWYIYRPVGEVVAVLQTGVYNDSGQSLLFSDEVLDMQESIAKSLHPVEKERFKGAVFAGSNNDSYPYINP